jgi:hypothetical protein
LEQVVLAETNPNKSVHIGAPVLLAQFLSAQTQKEKVKIAFPKSLHLQWRHAFVPHSGGGYISSKFLGGKFIFIRRSYVFKVSDEGTCEI